MVRKSIWILAVLSVLIIFCSAGAGASINGLSDEYVIGDTITILITNSKEPVITATLEANEFGFDKDNVNFKRSFVASSSGPDKKKTWTLKIDTTDIPAGTYNIVIYGKNGCIATSKVKLVLEKRVLESQKENSQVYQEPPENEEKKPAPSSPGFGYLSLLGAMTLPIILGKKIK